MVSKPTYVLHKYVLHTLWVSLREKCPCLEFFLSVFSRIWTEYIEIFRISPYSIRMRKKTDQKNIEYGRFSRTVFMTLLLMLIVFLLLFLLRHCFWLAPLFYYSSSSIQVIQSMSLWNIVFNLGNASSFWFFCWLYSWVFLITLASFS